MGMGRRVPCVPWEWGQGSRRAQRAARARLSTPRALGCPHGAQGCPYPGHRTVPILGIGLSPPWSPGCPCPGHWAVPMEHRAVPTPGTRLSPSWAPGCPCPGHRAVPMEHRAVTLHPVPAPLPTGRQPMGTAPVAQPQTWHRVAVALLCKSLWGWGWLGAKSRGHLGLLGCSCQGRGLGAAWGAGGHGGRGDGGSLCTCLKQVCAHFKLVFGLCCSESRGGRVAFVPSSGGNWG